MKFEQLIQRYSRMRDDQDESFRAALKHLQHGAGIDFVVGRLRYDYKRIDTWYRESVSTRRGDKTI